MSAAKRARDDGAAAAKKPTMIMRPLGTSGIEVSAIAMGCFAFGGDKKTGTHLGAQMTALHNGVWGDQADEDTFATIKAALDLGVNFFDNAEMYGDGYAEEVMGRALKASGYKRDQYYIGTKVSESYLEPTLLKQHVDESIERMGCDYIDLYQLHWCALTLTLTLTRRLVSNCKRCAPREIAAHGTDIAALRASRAAVKTDKYPERPLVEEVPMEDTLKALEECKVAGKIKHIGVCNFGVQVGQYPIVTFQYS